jgi:hypothetical protein
MRITQEQHCGCPKFTKRAICEVHGTILSGHDALKKTYLRLTNYYPMHSISLVFFGIVILFLCYKMHKLYRKKIHDKLKATLPATIAVHIPPVPSAPPPYVHNQPNSMGMINIPLQ